MPRPPPRRRRRRQTAETTTTETIEPLPPPPSPSGPKGTDGDDDDDEATVAIAGTSVNRHSKLLRGAMTTNKCDGDPTTVSTRLMRAPKSQHSRVNRTVNPTMANDSMVSHP